MTNRGVEGAPAKCPPECKKELSFIREDIEEIKAMEKTQWEEIAKRPKLGPLLWIAGLAIAVLGSLLGLIYGQNQKTHDDVVGLKIQSERVETKLEVLENAVDRNNHNRTDTHGG